MSFDQLLQNKYTTWPIRCLLSWIWQVHFLSSSPPQSCQWTRRSSPSRPPCWGTARTTRLCRELCPSWPRWRRRSTSCTRTRPMQISTSSLSYWETTSASSPPSRYEPTEQNGQEKHRSQYVISQRPHLLLKLCILIWNTRLLWNLTSFVPFNVIKIDKKDIDFG